MPTLRIALAQVNSTVGDIAGNAATVRRWSRRAADAGAQLVAFPEMMLTGYPVEDLVFRDSFVAASRDALERSPPTWPPTGSATSPSWSATWTPTARPRPAPTPTPGAGRATRSALLLGGRVVATLLQAPPAQLRRLRRGPLLRSRRHAAVVPDRRASTSRSTVCEDIWQAGGPFAAAAAGRRRPGRQHQRLAVRAEQGRRAAAAGARGAPPRRAPPSPTSTWSAARTSWSSTATR